MSGQVYFQGQFWECVEATNPGESPVTHPAKWRRLPIPKDALHFVVAEAYALLLSPDGQDDKSRLARRAAQAELDKSILAMRRFNAQPDTIHVLTR